MVVESGKYGGSACFGPWVVHFRAGRRTEGKVRFLAFGLCGHAATPLDKLN